MDKTYLLGKKVFIDIQGKFNLSVNIRFPKTLLTISMYIC